jgi:hypothetical protein
MMSFLTPLFLIGALAIGVPVILHLIRRTTRQRIPFSSLMFLEASPPQLTRRSRLEHLLLLLLRCGVICLLALGFARPFIKKVIIPPPSTGVSHRMVILVDTSASMKRAKLAEDARARVRAVLEKTSPMDQVALFAFDRHVRPLLTFEEWQALPAGERVSVAVSKLSQVSAGALATDLAGALIAAAETLADTPGSTALPTRQQIVLVSDLQEGSRLEGLQHYEWPKEISLVIEPVRAIHSDNAGLQLITSTDDGNVQDHSRVRIRVTNEARSKKEQFKVGWAQTDGRTLMGEPSEVYVPAGQSRTVLLPVLPQGLSAERIILQGDEDPFDNTLYVVPPEQARLKVLYCGTGLESDPRTPLYFLIRAFQNTPRQAVQLVVRSEHQPLTPAEIKDAEMLIVSETLAEERVQLLHEQVASGKSLLFSFATPQMAATLARLLKSGPISAEPANPARYAMWADIDFRHALFAPFADPRFSDFTKIHFWKYNKFDVSSIAAAHILAKFDSGDPAVVEVPVGRGRVIILGFGLGADDSQLPLSTKYVPFLYTLLEQSIGAPQLASQYFVGDRLPLAALASADNPSPTVTTPEGLELKLSATETNFSNTLNPGIYKVSSRSVYRFAVNLDPAESRTASLSPDELEKRGLPVINQTKLVGAAGQPAVRLQNAELENRQKIWRYVLIAALAMLLLESWLAGNTAKRGMVKA